MGNNHDTTGDFDSPGSGAGQASDSLPKDMQKEALEKEASFPGSEENAAGMSGKRKAAAGQPADEPNDPEHRADSQHQDEL